MMIAEMDEQIQATIKNSVRDGLAQLNRMIDTMTEPLGGILVDGALSCLAVLKRKLHTMEDCQLCQLDVEVC